MNASSVTKWVLSCWSLSFHWPGAVVSAHGLASYLDSQFQLSPTLVVLGRYCRKPAAMSGSWPEASASGRSPLPGPPLTFEQATAPLGEIQVGPQSLADLMTGLAAGPLSAFPRPLTRMYAAAPGTIDAAVVTRPELV